MVYLRKVGLREERVERLVRVGVVDSDGQLQTARRRGAGVVRYVSPAARGTRGSPGRRGAASSMVSRRLRHRETRKYLAGASGPAGPDAPAAEHPVVTKPSRSLAEGVGGTDGPTENGRYSAEANKRSRVGRTADPDRARSASPRHRCRREGRLRSSSTQYSLEFIGRRRPDVRMMAHDGRPPQAVRHAGGDDRSGERSDPPRSRRAVSRRSTRPRNVRTGRCCRMSKSRGPYGPGSLSSSLIQEDLCCRAGCRR
jgi:hypothetical protein